MTTRFVALSRAGLSATYRCVAGYHVREFREGIELYPCQCGESWLPLVADNCDKKQLLKVLVGQGIIYTMGIAELPEVGDLINLFQGTTLVGPLDTGSYRVRSIRENVWQGQLLFHFEVEREGPMYCHLLVHVLDGFVTI